MKIPNQNIINQYRSWLIMEEYFGFENKGVFIELVFPKEMEELIEITKATMNKNRMEMILLN